MKGQFQCFIEIVNHLHLEIRGGGFTEEAHRAEVYTFKVRNTKEQ